MPAAFVSCVKTVEENKEMRVKLDILHLFSYKMSNKCLVSLGCEVSV